MKVAQQVRRERRGNFDFCLRVQLPSSLSRYRPSVHLPSAFECFSRCPYRPSSASRSPLCSMRGARLPPELSPRRGERNDFPREAGVVVRKRRGPYSNSVSSFCRSVLARTVFHREGPVERHGQFSTPLWVITRVSVLNLPDAGALVGTVSLIGEAPEARHDSQRGDSRVNNCGAPKYSGKSDGRVDSASLQ